MARLKPHLYYLTAKTPSETIADFKKSFIVFEILYFLLTGFFVALVHFMGNMLELEIVLPVFMGLILLFGTFILPQIHAVAKLLNDKGVMDIAPALLTSLQFIFNITVTSFIIPVFLWIKCREIEARRDQKNISS